MPRAAVARRRQGDQQGDRHQDQRRGDGDLRRRAAELSAGEGPLPDKPLVAFVPISLRELGNTDINNQVFGMMCQIATDVADPVERLKAIRRHPADSKQLAGT